MVAGFFGSGTAGHISGINLDASASTPTPTNNYTLGVSRCIKYYLVASGDGLGVTKLTVQAFLVKALAFLSQSR